MSLRVKKNIRGSVFWNVQLILTNTHKLIWEVQGD